jgi:YVTN family beta-propeller protein
MNKALIFIFSLLLLSTGVITSQSLNDIEKNRVVLPNRWGITKIGKTINLGDLPLNMAISKFKKLLAVTNNGQSDQTIQLIDVKNQLVLDTFLIGKSWLGLAFGDHDKSLYVSGGNDNCILRFDIRDNKLSIRDTFKLGKPWPELISTAGIALDEKRGFLYAVTKENNSLYVVNINSKNDIKSFSLGGEAYTCILSPDKITLFISCWGCDKVILFDTKTQKFISQIAVGDNPNDLCITDNGKFLFVANANDNSVSVIDVVKRKVIENLNASLYPDSPMGSTTNSLALSEDNKMLYVANADNNCLAVFDIRNPGNSLSKGFIPTGWYPTCVRVIDNNIYISNGKGFTSLPNPKGPNPVRKEQEAKYQKSGDQKKDKVQYIGGLFRGTLSIIPAPDQNQLNIYSAVVYNNTPYSIDKKDEPGGEKGNPIPARTGDYSPIRYVFYIIKENRTYDQVLGDMPEGNGDTSLVLFGEKITPNQHALAREFVLLDNFYVDGEVSADGHNWSTGAYATDFLEKNWPTSYGGRGGFYNAEGTREVANNKNGFIWDLCKKYGISYRTYGEFADDFKPNIPALKDHFCPYYTSWDQSVRDTTRFNQWKRDFDSLLVINKVPQLNTLRFINDHTEGLSAGRYSPAAHVSDNDYAVGLFIEYLSHSSIWNESAVFVVEDDAQNGPDHVDAHRSPAFIAGGFVKRHYVDHTMYSTSSVLRTIELILGLPPMSQYDAAAIPLWRCFEKVSNNTPYNCISPKIDIQERNIAMNKWQKMSEKLDFSKEDRAPDPIFNEIIWYAMKGNEDCPPPVHAAFFNLTESEDDD